MQGGSNSAAGVREGDAGFVVWLAPTSAPVQVVVTNGGQVIVRGSF
jgi:hypothetical protein